jgi:hypothetical protein
MPLLDLGEVHGDDARRLDQPSPDAPRTDWCLRCRGSATGRESLGAAAPPSRRSVARADGWTGSAGSRCRRGTARSGADPPSSKSLPPPHRILPRGTPCGCRPRISK